jgi:aspartyl-tRNA(Asn)/glutamyl-tRNA(Gln) amidotransferase subunit A
MKLATLTASELKTLLARNETTCREIMSSVLDSIEEVEGTIRAYITVRPRDELLRAADAVDARRGSGAVIGPLAGLPVAVKDNLCTKGLKTTCASRMLENFVPPYDATVIKLVEQADGIVIGKTNLDEFSMGSTTENSAMQITRNPWNPDYVPGGTSGGSAAAVAANETILALGSDTGGSIRQPASFCGVVGLKPTYGRVSRYGLVAYASSLDQIGVLAKNVEDAETLFSVIARHDPLDSTSLNSASPRRDYSADFPRGLRIGIPQEFFGPGLHPDVRQAVQQSVELLCGAGAEQVPIALPHAEYAIPAYYILACAEMSSNLARYDGCRYGHRARGEANVIEMVMKSRAEAFGPEVKRRVILGTYVLSSGYYDAYYVRAAKTRTLIRQDFDAAFKKCDVVLHPVAPTPPFRLGEKTNDPLAMYLVDIYSVIANLTGLPAISVPCGFSADGLPIGVQLAGPALSEEFLFRVSRVLESLLEKQFDRRLSKR